MSRVAGRTAPRPKPGRVESAIFYYPWYGSAGDQPEWFHWNNNGHKPPVDIAANFYPARGPYSSSDFSILQQHMADIRGAGVDTGTLSINSNSSVRFSTPFGGFKQSGLGRELSMEALNHYSELKTVFWAG